MNSEIKCTDPPTKNKDEVHTHRIIWLLTAKGQCLQHGPFGCLHTQMAVLGLELVLQVGQCLVGMACNHGDMLRAVVKVMTCALAPSFCQAIQFIQHWRGNINARLKVSGHNTTDKRVDHPADRLPSDKACMKATILPGLRKGQANAVVSNRPSQSRQRVYPDITVMAYWNQLPSFLPVSVSQQDLANPMYNRLGYSNTTQAKLISTVR